MTVADGAKREGATLPVRPSWLPPDGELRAFLGDSALYPFYRLRLVEYIARLLPSRGPSLVKFRAHLVWLAGPTYYRLTYISGM